MTINDIQFAADKKFTDFSNAVKCELKNKLTNHESVQRYKTDFERIQNIKSLFAKINSGE